MKKLKNIFYILFVITLFTTSVSALESNYYINQNGVSMNREQYDWLVKRHDEKFVEFLTQEQFNHFLDKMDREVVSESVVYSKISNYKDSTGNTMIEKEEKISEEEYLAGEPTNNKSRVSCGDGCWETNYKKLYADTSYFPNDTFSIYSTLTWKQFPNTRSNDIYGILYNNFNVSSRMMYMYYKRSDENAHVASPLGASGSILKTYINGQNGGWAGIYMLPSNFYKYDYLSFEMESIGKSYTNDAVKFNVSYQHAQSYIDWDVVYNNLRWSSSGLGGVFNLGSYNSVYDNMQGLSLSIRK